MLNEAARCFDESDSQRARWRYRRRVWYRFSASSVARSAIRDARRGEWWRNITAPGA